MTVAGIGDPGTLRVFSLHTGRTAHKSVATVALATSEGGEEDVKIIRLRRASICIALRITRPT